MIISAAQPGRRISRSASGSNCAVALTERPDSDTAWRVRVLARSGGRLAEVGEILTTPPLYGGRPSRWVCVARLPGAHEWIVEITRAAGTEPSCEVVLADGPGVGPPGVEALERGRPEVWDLSAVPLVIPIVRQVVELTAAADPAGAGGALTIDAATHNIYPGGVLALGPAAFADRVRPYSITLTGGVGVVVVQ